MTIYMADISEFQTNVDAPTYLKYHKNIICRVHNGNRPDNMMPGRRDYLRKYAFKGIGWYQYLVANRDPSDQAHEFINTVGSLRTNEWPILDIESGSSDQYNRAREWCNVVAKWANLNPMVYSGAYFWQDQLRGAGAWKGYPIWVASYGSAEPSMPHMLWQYTDHAQYGAITPSAADSNIHHGKESDFIYDVRHAKSGG